MRRQLYRFEESCRLPRSGWVLLVIASAWAAVVGGASAGAPREMGLLPAPRGDLLGFDKPGDVPVVPDEGELVVQKVMPADCRVVLGFVHSPVDGRIDSWGYNGVVQEYDDSQGYGRGGHWQNVTYEFLAEPGLHVALADDAGFNYLYVRGGFIGKVYRDVDALEGPGCGKLILDVKSATGPEGSDHFLLSRHAFSQPVKAKRISFFLKDGLLADVEFLRVGQTAVSAEYSDSMDYRIGSPVEDVTGLGPDFVRLPAENPAEQHPSNFCRRFFRDADRCVHRLSEDQPGEAVELGPGQQLHLITPVLEPFTPVGAVRVDLRLDGVPEGNLVNLTVQDPLIGNQELLRVDVRSDKAGRVRCLLDFPDQLVGLQGRFWLTIASQHGGTLLTESTISLLTVPRKVAREEHLAYRLFLLKGYFYVLSEARPWNNRDMSVEWLTAYDGREWNIQRLRPQLVDMFRTVEHLRQIAPNHPIAVGQYDAWLTRKRRERLDPRDIPELPEIPGVQRWAQLLDRAATGVVGIPNWWIEHRMAPNGELGGFLGDDTDMLQWWVPCALLDSEQFLPNAREVFQRINRLVLEHNLRDGVNLAVTDALHAYEEGTNHTCLMPLLFYGEPQYLEQLMLAARTTEKWTSVTDRGTLRFHTNDFGWETAQHPPQEPVEKVSGNAALLLHPHLILAWYNGDPRAADVIRRYLEEHGDDVPYAYGGGMTLSFGTYWLTGDPTYLRLPPDGRDKRGNWWARFHPEFPAHGKEAWAQPWWRNYQRAISRQWQLGDWAWAVAQDREVLEKSLEHVLWGTPGSRGGGVERFRYMWTEAEQFTDRVFLPVELVAQTMLGGYNVRNRLWPAYAVSYENLGGDFAALVLEQGRDHLKLAMINLRQTPRAGAFRVWQLDHGKYRLTTGPDTDDDGEPDRVERTAELTLKRMDVVPVELPPRRLVIYDLRQTEKLDDVYLRADLAVGASDLSVQDDTLKVSIHNLGRSPAKDFAVTLVDDSGRELARRRIDLLPPPRDLVPSRTIVTLPLTDRAARVLLDPDGEVPELTDLNNVRATLMARPEESATSAVRPKETAE